MNMYLTIIFAMISDIYSFMLSIFYTVYINNEYVKKSMFKTYFKTMSKNTCNLHLYSTFKTRLPAVDCHCVLQFLLKYSTLSDCVFKRHQEALQFILLMIHKIKKKKQKKKTRSISKTNGLYPNCI
jgi:hypothetical protein